MDCRETQALLTAFHDGELTAADRARVEEHLRGCPECRALLADLARADQAAGVPDPGPAYWDRFNARVMDRVEREADGPKGAVLRPKHGWMRQQLRYLVPAAAAAALVVGIVRYGGMTSRRPRLSPAVPPATREPAVADPAVQRKSKAEPGTRATKAAESTAAAGTTSSPAPRRRRTGDRRTAGGAEPPGRSFPADRERGGDRGIARPHPPPSAYRRRRRWHREMRPDGQGRPGAGRGGDADGFRRPGRRNSALDGGDAPRWPGTEERRDRAGGIGRVPASRPARLASRARTLAERERIREAEDAQRACLAGDLPAPSREKGLVFLAELLDRQARFAEADAVIAEVDRRFPQSRPLELYRQQRPMVQKHPMAVPVTR